LMRLSSDLVGRMKFLAISQLHDLSIIAPLMTFS
jgi:hypothetical protein